ELCPTAVNRLHSLFFEFGQPIENVVEIGQHEAEEDASHQVSKAGECHERNRQIEEIAGLNFGLATLLQHTTVQQLVQRPAVTRGLEDPIERVQPDRGL